MCKIKKLPEMLFYRSSERLKTPHLTSRVFTVNLEGSLGLYNVCHTSATLQLIWPAMQNKVTVFILIQLAPRATYSQLISQSEQRLLRDSWRQRNLKWFITHTILKNHDNVKQKSWIRWSMSFKFRKCNGLPVVSPELAQIDELRNSSALTPKWSERGSSDTGVRISSNSLYWFKCEARGY